PFGATMGETDSGVGYGSFGFRAGIGASGYRVSSGVISVNRSTIADFSGSATEYDLSLGPFGATMGETDSGVGYGSFGFRAGIGASGYRVSSGVISVNRSKIEIHEDGCSNFVC
ncbi:hypothetical protein PD716_25130, partial [Vibrio gigantis]|uniref:hypothetical protein n=1 Tax=Vibrio gigantis TaxID=296199 RepID=UPI002FC97446